MPTTPINLGPSAVNTPVTAESATMRGRLGLGSSSTLNAAFENGNNNIRFTDPATGATVYLTSSNVAITTADSLVTPRAFDVSGDAVSIVSPPTFNGTSGVTLPITISPNAITTGKIANLAVTPAKLSTGGPSWNSGGVLTATSFSGPLTGNASTATTLATARTITLSGDVAGSVSFNGSADVTITTTSAQATTSAAGKVELATQAEVDTGSDTARAVTPATLKSSPGAAKAWVTFNGTGTPAIIGSYNVSSITDNGMGDYTINFTVPLPNANYVFTGIATGASNIGVVRQKAAIAPTVSALTIQVTNSSGSPIDSTRVDIVVFGRDL